MLTLHALPAFEDNYVWALATPDGRAIVVDPGQSAPVLASGLEPVAILLTHHHADHIGGTAHLLERWNVPVHAPDDDRITVRHAVVREGARVSVAEAGVEFEVMEVPGHTRSHVAFVGAGHLFCGDTLFSLGCGRSTTTTSGRSPATMAAQSWSIPARPRRCSRPA